MSTMHRHVLVVLLLLVHLAAAAREYPTDKRVFETSPHAYSEDACPWSRKAGYKVDIEFGFWVGRCGAVQMCDQGAHIVEFRMGTFGAPSDACAGPTGLINYCLKHNTGASFGYVQGVCSNGKKLALYQASGSAPTDTVSQPEGFTSANGTHVGTCCQLGGFMGCGVTHMPYPSLSCPAGKKIAGYVVGIERVYDNAARKLVDGTVGDFSYIGLLCR